MTPLAKPRATCAERWWLDLLALHASGRYGGPPNHPHDDRSRQMAHDVAFLRESPFWYFLARRDLECSAQTRASPMVSC